MNLLVVTTQYVDNYGAVLQSYGFKTFLEKSFDADVTFLKPSNYNDGIFEKMLPLSKSTIFTAYANLKKIKTSVHLNKRKKSFLEFERSYFKEITDEGNLTCFDAYITGGDQMFNRSCLRTTNNLLPFAPDGKPKLSYSTSMGSATFSEQEWEGLSKAFDRYDAISLREESAIDSLKNRTETSLRIDIDGSFLIDKDCWNSVSKFDEKRFPEKYILVYELMTHPGLTKAVEKVRKQYNLPVVRIADKPQKNNDYKVDVNVLDAGPAEFLGLFKNAECVVTTSFHGTCFSVINEKPLVSLVHQNEKRIPVLLEKCGLSECFKYEIDDDFTLNKPDFSKACEFINNGRVAAKEYLSEYLIKSGKRMNNITQFNKCSNCGACYNICPVNAISVNKQNYFYSLEVDNAKCTDCGLCTKVCPVNNEVIKKQNISEAYSGINKNQTIVGGSSSGGVFTALAEFVQANNGVVYSFAYDEDLKSVSVYNTDERDLGDFRRSKYVESNVNDSFKEIKTVLGTGRIVLFCGSPCQVAGLHHYLRKEYDNLYTVDFICGGFPSHKLYEEHLEMLERKYKSKITSVNFRPKTIGWGRYVLKITFENGKVYEKPMGVEPYFYAFAGCHLSVRDYCKECKFVNNHISDLVISDFWSYSKVTGLASNDTGISLVLVNSNKGKGLLEAVSENVTLKSVDVEKAFDPKERIVTPELLAKRKAFFDNVEKCGLSKACADAGMAVGKNAFMVNGKYLVKKALKVIRK